MKTLLLAFLFAANGFARQTAGPAFSRPVVFRVAGMDKVELRNDVGYKKVEGRSQFADIYIPRPRADDARFPAVILIHGTVGDAPVLPKEWGAFRSWAELLSASGMVGIAFNHRQSAADLADLTLFLQENAEYFDIDPDRICLAAFSTGGALLNWAVREKRPFVQCLVSFYPRLEFPPSAGMPPIFIARGGMDQTDGINVSIDRFVQQAIAANAPVTVANHPGAPHHFDTLLNDVRSREIVKMSLEFMRWHLGVTRR